LEQKKKILIVEDDWFIARQTEKRVKNLGYDVIGIVPSGEKTIEIVNQTPPDLILMDIMLDGDIDGIETAKLVNETNNIPILYITAFADKKLIERAAITGPHGYLNKPIKEEELYSSIEIALYKHKMELALLESHEQLKQSEEKYKILFERTADAIYIYDPDTTNIIDANSATSKMYGYSREELIDLPCMKFSTEIKESASSIYKIRKEDKITFNQRLHRKKNGAVFPVEVNSYAITIGNKNFMFAVSKDITVQKRGETDKKALEKQLHQLQKNEAIGALAGGIAHDFNNILFPIMGFAEILDDDISNDSPLKESVNEIIMGTQRAKELVKQILTFSRQSEQEIKPLKPHLIIEEVIKLIKSTIPASIEIKQSIDPECRTIMADPTQVHQIVMNLITNAYHAMPDMGGVLSITLKNVDFNNSLMELRLDAGPHILISIEDNGIGMDQNTINKIFDPYFSTKPVGKGTGLGLSVVQGIVKNYGGDIEVKSSPGNGSLFNIYLPSYETGSIPEGEIKNTIYPKGNEKILIIDDEAPVRRLQQKILERLGYDVDTSESSKEALNQILNHPNRYDLIITDMTMPEMTGDILSQEIKKINPDLPIIICTGYSEKLTPERASAIGIDEVLFKPIIKAQLAQTIRNILD